VDIWRSRIERESFGLSRGRCRRSRRARRREDTVSLWVRDVDFAPRPRSRGHRSQRLHPHRVAKLAQIEELRADGIGRIGELDRKQFLVAGVALYAGEGAKTDGCVAFANSDPRMIHFFVAWLRHLFDIDESRLRLRMYLHAGLDLEVANAFWSNLTGIPVSQFGVPYRAVPDASIRTTKHPLGCPSVRYACSRTHRESWAWYTRCYPRLPIPG
jgi:hypothetical protein